MQIFPCVIVCLSGVYSGVVVKCIPAYLETAINFIHLSSVEQRFLCKLGESRQDGKFPNMGRWG